jgi:hypothetical protein
MVKLSDQVISVRLSRPTTTRRGRGVTLIYINLTIMQTIQDAGIAAAEDWREAMREESDATILSTIQGERGTA